MQTEHELIRANEMKTVRHVTTISRYMIIVYRNKKLLRATPNLKDKLGKKCIREMNGGESSMEVQEVKDCDGIGESMENVEDAHSCLCQGIAQTP